MKNLRDFLHILRQNSELATVTAPVNTNLELAEIHRRVISAGGPALFFTNVHQDGKTLPYSAVSNLFGTRRRIDLAFGKRPQQFVQNLIKLTQKPPSPKLLWRQRKDLWQATKIGLKQQKRGAILERHNDIDLEQIPFIKSWPEDGGHFATLPLVYTENLEEGMHNLGMYRMQRFGVRETGMHWQIHKGGGYHFHNASGQKVPLEVSVFFGGAPAMILAAVAPLPENVGELLLASLLIGQKVALVERGESHPLVAEAEFALSGKIYPEELRQEGPFGDHYGYYSLEHPYPVFRVEDIYHRKDAILPVTVVGKPRQEDFIIGDYLQDLLSPVFPLVMSGVVKLWSYGEAGNHALASAVVKERYPREAMASAFAILGQGQLSLTKFLLLLDKPMELANFKQVLGYILARSDLSRDLYIFDQLSMDTLDYTGPEVNKGSKAVLLGVGEAIRNLPRDTNGLPDWIRKAAIFTPGCLVIDTGKSFARESLSPQEMARDKHLSAWPLVVLVDNAEQAARTTARFLWTTFTRFEPAADIYTAGIRQRRNTVSYRGPMLWDCRMKTSYPRELFCDEATRQTVDKRWTEYFPQGMAMGDGDNGHLDLDD